MQDRDCQMCGRSKSEKSDTVTGFHSGATQTAKTDDARTQKRSGMQISEFGRKVEHERVACCRILGVTAVDGVSSEDGGIAEIFETAVAVRAVSIPTANPGDSNA